MCRDILIISHVWVADGGRYLFALVSLPLGAACSEPYELHNQIDAME